MADIVGGGTTDFGGLSTDANGSVFWVHIELEYPEDGHVYPSTLMMVGFTREVSDPPDIDNESVQVQAASDDDFTTIVFDSVINDVVGDGVTIQSVDITALTNLSTYWWRARPVYPGAFQPPWEFYEVRHNQINISAGDVLEYGDSNIGVMVTQESTVLEYGDSNLGIEAILKSGNWEYVNLNHGIAIILKSLGAEYVHEGDVSTNMPDPHIWFLRPTAGRPYDGIDIVGFGFGDLQETWNATPQISLLVGVWEALAVTDWQAFPPTAAAYTAGRTIDETWDGYIDPQHQIISIIIPGGAKPPGHPVRVKTEE